MVVLRREVDARKPQCVQRLRDAVVARRQLSGPRVPDHLAEDGGFEARDLHAGSFDASQIRSPTDPGPCHASGVRGDCAGRGSGPPRDRGLGRDGCQGCRDARRPQAPSPRRRRLASRASRSGVSRRSRSRARTGALPRSPTPPARAAVSAPSASSRALTTTAAPKALPSQAAEAEWTAAGSAALAAITVAVLGPEMRSERRACTRTSTVPRRIPPAGSVRQAVRDRAPQMPLAVIATCAQVVAPHEHRLYLAQRLSADVQAGRRVARSCRNEVQVGRLHGSAQERLHASEQRLSPMPRVVSRGMSNRRERNL